MPPTLYLLSKVSKHIRRMTFITQTQSFSLVAVTEYLEKNLI